jgi:hypothetical protein
LATSSFNEERYRVNLALDVLTLRDQPSRLAWLAGTIPNFRRWHRLHLNDARCRSGRSMAQAKRY